MILMLTDKPNVCCTYRLSGIAVAPPLQQWWHSRSS